MEKMADMLRRAAPSSHHHHHDILQAGPCGVCDATAGLVLFVDDL